jgi:hypothetical protein
VRAFWRVFRDPVRTGRRGRPRLVVAPGWLMGQVIKRYARRWVVRGPPRPLPRCSKPRAVEPLSTPPLSSGSMHLCERPGTPSAPRTRHGSQRVLTAGMYSLGCAYNVCGYHDRLGLAAPENAPPKWPERTPAMAAGLTDCRWTRRERLLLKVPLPPWVASKRRGRPPKQKLQPIRAMAA